MFCTISFLSLSFSMISSKFSNITPNFKIGFPFEMTTNLKLKHNVMNLHYYTAQIYVIRYTII